MKRSYEAVKTAPFGCVVVVNNDRNDDDKKCARSALA